jgi:hypothetical protein
MKVFGKAVLISSVVCLMLFGQAAGQMLKGNLRGRVTDPSGAVMAQAKVTVTNAAGQTLTATTDQNGVYEIKDIQPGKCAVHVDAKGFSPFDQADVDVFAGQTQKFDVTLEIAVQQQTVNVEDQGTKVDVSSDNNASAVVIKGKDLEALSDDPDELQSDLEALAGPSAGPNGGEIYIDGFSGGTLPPKSAIREIRVNQNPFSAQYDHIGYGRVEVFTKPGQDQYHGQFMANFNNSRFNSLSPFLHLNGAGAVAPPDYHSEMYNGSFGGPINSKSSFFFNVQRRNINETSIVDATQLDSNFNPVPFSTAVLNPRTRTEIGPRIDYQLATNNTLTARYEYETSNGDNNGIGQYNLPSYGYNNNSAEHNLQISDTQVINSTTINETRFQFNRDSSNQTALTFAPTISVLDTFTGGGNGVGRSSDISKHYELQNYTSKIHGNHFIRFGGRLRVNTDANNANNNFNGSYTFTSLYAYQTAQQGLANGWTPEQIISTCSVDPGTNNELCGGPNQFAITYGSPLADVTQVDAGLYAEDDWKIRPNFTLSGGLRYETQDNISDHADWAPRIGFAWGIGGGSSPKTVLRGGFGIFYDRFSQGLVMNVARLNGSTQQQYILGPVAAATFFPGVPTLEEIQALLASGGDVTAPQLTTYKIAPDLRTPYTMQTAVTLERQILKASKVAVTYISSRGLHQLVSENINAPSADGTRPYGDVGNIYQYQSAGTFKQNQLMANSQLVLGKNISLFGWYSLSYANTNTNGAGSFPSIPGDLSADWGRAAFNVRHRGMIGGTVGLPYGFRLSPFIMANSSRPFNIVIGEDLNGDNIYNDRPSFAAASACQANPLPPNIMMTSWGCFNLAPAPGDPRIPINYGVGPAFFSANLRVAKTFGLGKKLERGGGGQGPGGGPGGHGGGHDHGHGPMGGMMGGMGGGSGQRYSLTFAASARNLFNNVNPASPSGTLISSRFGESNSIQGMGSSANRRIDFQVMFNF